MSYDDWDDRERMRERMEDERYEDRQWEHDNEPDYQALRDEERVSMLYDQYVEDEYNRWCDEQQRQAEAYFDMLTYIDIIEGAVTGEYISFIKVPG